MKFILSRVNDKENHSKKWIIGYALLFWLITRIIAAGLVIACVTVYESHGISQDMLPSFGGTPKAYQTLGRLIYGLLITALIAPLIEEMVFRLGLSFKKFQVAMSLASIPVMIAWWDIKVLTWWSILIYIACAIILFTAIYRFSSQENWNKIKSRWLIVSIWITSFAFGLAHLRAFSYYSWEMVPYMLCMISVPFFAGCSCAYLRVNLGFGWGLGMHIFNNIPAIILIISMYQG